jgi:hypothetical protein
MTDEIIDITGYFKREPASDLPRGAMALWGADGERARFALPLWRVIHLAQAERGMILWSGVDDHRRQTPFVALDLGADPARTDVADDVIPRFGVDESPSLLDRDADGLVVYLGSQAGRRWTLFVDGGTERRGPLVASVREDILFLAGECAGLLFLRELAEDSASTD